MIRLAGEMLRGAGSSMQNTTAQKETSKQGSSAGAQETKPSSVSEQGAPMDRKKDRNKKKKKGVTEVI